MNDFTDDSAVKFYLNRRTNDKSDDSVLGHGDEDGDQTLIANSSFGGDSDIQSPQRQTFLSVSSSNGTPRALLISFVPVCVAGCDISE